MSILGSRVQRVEDPQLLTDGGTYTADVRDPLLEGSVHATYVRSTMPHATITELDTSGAESAPGVLGVFTNADFADLPLIPAKVPLYPEPMMARPWLADGVVRFVGEPVAVIITEDPTQGEDAAESVWIDYEPLEAVIDPEDAARDEVLLHPDAGTNTIFPVDGEAEGDPFADCEVVVRRTIRNQRVAAVPLETRSAAGTWDGERPVLWASSQAPHGVKKVVESVYEGTNARVVAPDVGGGFGAKIDCFQEELLLLELSRRVGRPVRWTETRSENLVSGGHGRAQIQNVTVGGSPDGTIAAYLLEILADGGAWPVVGSLLPALTRLMAPGVYAFPWVECKGKTVCTNTTTVMSYRGAGRPEAAAAVERAVDLFAAEIGMDPAEVRRKNFIPEDAFPFTTGTGAEYDVGAYEKALDLALEAAGYQDLRAEQARRREAGEVLQMGIGVATYVEVTAGPFPGAREYAQVSVERDGSVTVLTGTSSHGQGHDTSWAMLAAEQLGVPMDQVTVIHGDTDVVPDGEGTFGSRSLQVGGSAIQRSAGVVVDRAREVAGDLLEAAVEDVVLDRASGRFHVAGTPAVHRTWAEVAEAAGEDALSVEDVFESTAPTYPFGAHVAVVEVDVETGLARLARMVAVDDAGTIVNPVVLEGQIHGGIAQGAAQALFEEVVFDEDGNPQTTNFTDYAFPSAAELPSFELVSMETPTPVNPLGVKGIGESGTIGSTPAVQNAVVDAVAHLGVRHIDMPTTPQRVYRAIQDATSDGSRG